MTTSISEEQNNVIQGQVHQCCDALLSVEARKKGDLQEAVVFVFAQYPCHLIQMYIDN